MLYIGSTDNIERRLRAHQKGYTQTTRKMKSKELAFSQSYNTLSHARRIERWLKGLKRKDYIEKIIKDGYIEKTF